MSSADGAAARSGRRQRDRRGSLICHGRLGSPFAIAPLAATVRVSALLALLVPLVGVVALSSPDSGPTRCATVALATLATHANSEYRPALRAATYLQPKDTVAVNGRIRHPGIMPSPGGPPRMMIGQMICAFGADDVAGSRPTFRKLRFQMIANTNLIARWVFAQRSAASGWDLPPFFSYRIYRSLLGEIYENMRKIRAFARTDRNVEARS